MQSPFHDFIGTRYLMRCRSILKFFINQILASFFSMNKRVTWMANKTDFMADVWWFNLLFQKRMNMNWFRYCQIFLQFKNLIASKFDMIKDRRDYLYLFSWFQLMQYLLLKNEFLTKICFNAKSPATKWVVIAQIINRCMNIM